jgi:hypothetical protein
MQTGELPMDRRTRFLWMKELVEHLGRCSEQWQHAEASAAGFLADAVERDLAEFQRICRSLRTDARGFHAT